MTKKIGELDPINMYRAIWHGWTTACHDFETANKQSSATSDNDILKRLMKEGRITISGFLKYIQQEDKDGSINEQNVFDFLTKRLKAIEAWRLMYPGVLAALKGEEAANRWMKHVTDEQIAQSLEEADERQKAKKLSLQAREENWKELQLSRKAAVTEMLEFARNKE